MRPNLSLSGITASRSVPIIQRTTPANGQLPSRSVATGPCPTIKPRSGNRAYRWLRQIFYGSLSETAAQHKLARARFIRQQIAFRQQEKFFADLYERPPAMRYARSWGKDDPVVRFDLYPDEPIGSWESDPDKPEKNKLCGGTKSWIDNNKKMVPDGVPPIAVWEENAPVTLANLAYAHVMSLNKSSFAVALPPDATPVDVEEIRTQQKANLAGCIGRGSPLTSFTVRPPMGKKLRGWGQAGRHIQLNGEAINLLTPHQIAWMIMEHANVAGIDEIRRFDWRRESGCFDTPDCDAVRVTEGRLREVGIDPDGQWTRREKAVFYVLVTDEHMTIGVTPAGSAKLVETQKSDVA